MNRREFLKGAAAAGFALAALNLTSHSAHSPARTVEAAAPGRVLRGTRDGRVLESLDRGASWQTVANFGPTREIVSVTQRGGLAFIRIAAEGHTFDLRSSDARTWRTLGALEGRA